MQTGSERNSEMNGQSWGILAAGAALVAGIVWFLRWVNRRSGPKEAEMDAMEGHDFEYFCADLLREAGFEEVEVTRGSGDYGADILCERDGVTYAVQCKCYESIVGVHAVQEVYAGKAFYGRMVAAVMTNRSFTDPARTCARRLNVLLWDRTHVEKMMEETGRQ